MTYMFKFLLVIVTFGLYYPWPGRATRASFNINRHRYGTSCFNVEMTSAEFYSRLPGRWPRARDCPS